MTIRSAVLADAEGIAHVQVDSWRSTYAGMIADEVLAQLSYAQRQQQWEQAISGNSLLYVAEALDGSIVGFICGGASSEQEQGLSAKLYALYLLKEHQRGGLGRRLVLALVEALLAQGHTSMMVDVLAANPSRAFYERLGGEYLGQKQITIDGHTYDDVAYGWRDLPALAERLRG